MGVTMATAGEETRPPHSSPHAIQYTADRWTRDIPILDPSQITTINNWLITFGACAPVDVMNFLEEPADVRTPAKFAAYYKIPYTSHDDKSAAADKYRDHQHVAAVLNVIVANALLRKVMWASSPELERLVLHGTREDHTDAYSVSKDGRAFYVQLRMMGSYQAHSAQQALVTEWSRILCAAYSPDGHKQVVVFNDVSSHESFTSSLLHIMINYERVPAQKVAPPVAFIETMLKLIIAEVPKLKTYAEAQVLEYSANPDLFGSRNAFYDDVAKRAKWLMPSHSEAHQTSLASPTLHAMNGPRRPAQPRAGPGTSTAPRQVRWFTACQHCDSRGCANTSTGGPQGCAVLGGAAPKPGATDDEKGHIATSRAFLKANPKYRQAPYLKGESPRRHLGAYTRQLAARASIALGADEHGPRRPLAGPEARKAIVEFKLAGKQLPTPSGRAAVLTFDDARDAHGEHSELEPNPIQAELDAALEDVPGEAPEFSAEVATRLNALFAAYGDDQDIEIDPDEMFCALEGHSPSRFTAMASAPGLRASHAARHGGVTFQEFGRRSAAVVRMQAIVRGAAVRRTLRQERGARHALASAYASPTYSSGRRRSPSVGWGDEHVGKGGKGKGLTPMASRPRTRSHARYEREPQPLAVGMASEVEGQLREALAASAAEPDAGTARSAVETVTEDAEDDPAETARRARQARRLCELRAASAAEPGADTARSAFETVTGAEANSPRPPPASLVPLQARVAAAQPQTAAPTCPLIALSRGRDMLIDDAARDAAVAREQAADAKALIDSHIAVASGDHANMRAEQRRLDERCDGHDLDLAQAVSQQRADMAIVNERYDAIGSECARRDRSLDQLRAEHDATRATVRDISNNLNQVPSPERISHLEGVVAERGYEADEVREALQASHNATQDDIAQLRAQVSERAATASAERVSSLRLSVEGLGERVNGLGKRVDDLAASVKASAEVHDAPERVQSPDRAAVDPGEHAADIKSNERLDCPAAADGRLDRLADAQSELATRVEHIANQQRAAADAQAKVNTKILHYLSHAEPSPDPIASALNSITRSAAALGALTLMLLVLVAAAIFGPYANSATQPGRLAPLACGYGRVAALHPARTNTSLFDNGATHSVVLSDHGAVPDSWRPDVPGLLLGDNSFMPAYGSIEVDFIPPPSVGGAHIRRRVLICPGAMGRVHSGGAEVDHYGSTVVDSPTERKLVLADGRELPLRVESNGLRWLDLKIKPTNVGTLATLAASGRHSDVGSRQPPPALANHLCRVTGVGKRPAALDPLSFLRLWHATLAHITARCLFDTLDSVLVVSNKPTITPEVKRAFATEHCDICNAYKQRKVKPTAEHPTVAVDVEMTEANHEATARRAHQAKTTSPTRALRGLYRIIFDVFGPVAVPSAQFNFTYVLGYTDEATGMRWVFGSKSHKAEDAISTTQMLRASLRLLLPHLDVDIARSDGAPENRSKAWRDYLAESLIVHEESIPYDPTQMGAQERWWGVIVPSARAMLGASNMSKAHWYSSMRHANLIHTVVASDVTTMLGGTKRSSAFERLFGVKPCGDHLRPYGAPVRYHLDPSVRDWKFDEVAEAGHYVGTSFENPTEMCVWNGSRHISVGGAHTIDTTRFEQPLVAPASHLPHWPAPNPDVAPAPAPPPRPPPAPKAPIISRSASLPNGTALDFRFLNEHGNAWEWYSGKVVGSRPKGANGLDHEIEWSDRAKWPNNLWLDLADPHRIWRTTQPPSATQRPPPKPPKTPTPPARHSPRLAQAVLPNNTNSAAYALAAYELLEPRHPTPADEATSVLIIFAGGAKDASLAGMLRKMGAAVDEIDILLGGPSQNVLLASVRRAIVSDVRAGKYDVVMLAPPCSSFSVAKGHPVRDCDHPLGLLDLSLDEQRYVARHNELVDFAAVVALTARARGAHFIIENPADRADPDSDAFWPEHARAASIWRTPQFKIVQTVLEPYEATFPQCMFGSDIQKFTTLWTSMPSVEAAFSNVKCTHVGKHPEVAHGLKNDGTYKSAEAAAYPDGMNRALANSILRVPLDASPAPPPAQMRLASTTKISGLHPFEAPPSHDSELERRFEAVRLYKRDKQKRRRLPVRFEQASLGLRRRAAAHAALAMQATGHRRDESIIALLDDAAELADMPAHEFSQTDVPEATCALAYTRFTRLGATVHPANATELDEAREVYIFEPLDADGDVHPALRLASARRVAPDRKTVVYFTEDGVAKAIEPKGVKEALSSLQSDQWRLAIDREIDNLKTHGAFHLVPVRDVLARGKRILRMTWVFKIKIDEGGRLLKYKARFCVVGSGQVQGCDYFESYASGARHSTVKTVLAIVVVLAWLDFHFDLDGAYLSAEIDTEVFVDQPAGIEHEVGPNGERMCYALDKAVYGTVQAGRLFSQKFRGALLDIGFEPSLDDEAVFRLDHRLGRIILATHVDDGIGGASTPEVLAWMYEQLEAKGFDFSQQGPWDTVLGFGCTRNHANRSVTLTARKQITDLAREHLCDEVAKSLNPPTPTDQSIMSLQPPPSETDAERAANEGWRSHARSLKGALIHIAHAHPAIQNGISRACKYMATPTHESYAAAKRILAWLNNRLDLGVTFGAPHLRTLDDLAPSAEPIMPMASERDYSLVCCVDSDLPGTPMQPRDAESSEPIDSASHRAQLGYNVSFAGGSLEASSRRQASTAVDTPAAELFAASTAAAVLVLIVSVVKFASFGRLGTTPVRIWCDNEAAVLVSKDATSIKRLAYIARRCHAGSSKSWQRAASSSCATCQATPTPRTR